MRREIILLVAGLAVAATLPVQEQVSSQSTSDVLKFILSASPEENDLTTTSNDKLFVVPTKTKEHVTQTEVIEQQPQEQDTPQDQPQPQEQDTPQDQPQPQEQDTPQNQPQPQEQDTPQDQLQEEDQDIPQDQQQPQDQDAPQGQPQQQDSEEVPIDEPSYPYITEVEAPRENVDFDATRIRPRPLPIIFPDVSAGGYEAPQEDEDPPSLNPESIIMYQEKMTPFSIDQDGEPFVSNLDEPQEKPVPYIFNEETYYFGPEEQPMDTPTSDFQEGLDSYNPDEYLHPISHIDFSLLDEEPEESEFERETHETQEESFEVDDYDHGFPMEGDQTTWEDAPSEYEDAPHEEPYYESQDDTEGDLLSWLIPDIFDDEPIENIDYSYETDYHDDMEYENPFANDPEMENTEWEESFVPEGFHEVVDYDDSFPDYEEDKAFVEETDFPLEEDFIEESDDYVSLADFFIPTYDSLPFSDDQPDYLDDGSHDDARVDSGFVDDESYFVDDGFLDVEPDMKSYQIEEDLDYHDDDMFADDDMFPESPSFENERVFPLWHSEDDEGDQTEYPEDIPITILETPPAYNTHVRTNATVPFILQILKRETEGDQMVELWKGTKSLMNDIMPSGEYDDIQHTNMNSLPNTLDNDGVDIIVVKDPRESFNGLFITPMTDDHVSFQRYPAAPSTQYREDYSAKPYPMSQGTTDQQFPKQYFSVMDDFRNRKTSALFNRMDNVVSYLRPLSHGSQNAPVIKNPYILNEIMDNDLPLQHLASPSTSRHFKSINPHIHSTPKIYPDESKSRRTFFRDLLQDLSPSLYDDTHYNGLAPHTSPMYPQPYKSFRHDNDLPRQYSFTSPPLPYSSPLNSFHGRDYPALQNYRPQTFSPYPSSNEMSGMFRENTMPNMYSRQPRRVFDDYNTFDAPPFVSRPRPRFPFFQRPRYSANLPPYKSFSFHNNRYDMGPYYSTPLYPRYDPEYLY